MILSIVIPIVGFVLALIKYTRENKKEAKYFALWGLVGLACDITIALGEIVGAITGTILLLLFILDGYNRLRTGKIYIDPTF